ncbi:hypothetical protein DFQ28_001246 [Apophysomyces sp. BC1034]|nr:hypothetical protein DFQ28_001246 [Apophysomyces sp. BC1034]
MHSFSAIVPSPFNGGFAGSANAFAMLPIGWQYAFALLFGLVIGSFITVVVHRVPLMLERAWHEELADYAQQTTPDGPATANDRHDAVQHVASKDPHDLALLAATPARYDLWMPRSACTACGHALRMVENIPLLSFVALRGRCSACGARISWRYPLIELSSALLAALSLTAFGATPTALIAFGFCAALLAMSAIDLATKLLPDSLTLPLLWAGLLVNLHAVFSTLDAAVIGTVAGYLSLWTVYWLFKFVRGVKGIGYGDIKLFAAIGAWFGWNALLQVILIASVCGATVGVGATLAKRMRLEEPLPFGPFLAGAAMLTLFFGTPFYRLLGVALTGGIGSGKTTLAHAFAAYGVPIVDTDVIAHRVTAPGGAAISSIRTQFGPAFITPEGALDRTRMRELVFRDARAKQRLEAITHPLIRVETDREMQTATGPYLICVVPLLVEAGNWHHRIDRVLVIDCTEQTQIERVMRRNGFTREQVRAIIARQATRPARLALADDVIVNEADSIEPLRPEIARLHQRYLALARNRAPS